MNKLVIKIVNRLIFLGLIEKDDKDIYYYQVEMLILKIIGILLIIGIGISTKKYIETIIFYITFSWLRAYTNGYHSKNYKVCLIQSGIAYTLICNVISLVFVQNLSLFHFITLISMIVIYALSPVNSDSIMLSEKEIIKHKEILKYIFIIYLMILAMFINFKVKSEFVAFFEIAIIFDMLLVLIGKIIYKDWR